MPAYKERKRRTPITAMLADKGVGWEFVAVLGTGEQYHDSTYKLYLFRKGKPDRWWRIEKDVPSLGAYSTGPYRYYTKPFLHVHGPVTAFPAWLKCMESQEGLLAAVQACRQLSGLEEVPSE